MPTLNLESGNFYHIYNRGINSCNLFENENNYTYFLNLYDKYISPIAQTYAWVLMPNHFHFLVYIKEDIIYRYSKDELTPNILNANRSKDAVGLEFNKWETIPKPDSVADLSAFKNKKIPNPKSHFSHLFNSYSKYFNAYHNRHGALFERPFKRKLIDSDEYLKQAIIYIHQNPVHHSFVSHPIEYPWSSYETCISDKTSKLKREEVIKMFDDKSNFIYCHQQLKDISDDMFL